MKLKKIWKERSLFYKILLILGLVISISIIILAILQLLGIYDEAINIFEPLLGVLMIIQAIENFKINKKLAVYSILVAIFIFLVFFVILLGR